MEYLSFLQKNLMSNTWVFADIFFIGYAFYNIVMHFNIGMIGTICRLSGYVLAYFVSKWLTYQASMYLGLRDQSSILIFALALFLFFGYFFYKSLRYVIPGSVSFFDGLLGAIYGIAETLLFLFIFNTTCIYVYENGFGIADWILVANGKKTESPDMTKPEIIYSIIKFGNSRTNIILPADKISGLFEMIKNEFIKITADLKPTAQENVKANKNTKDPIKAA